MSSSLRAPDPTLTACGLGLIFIEKLRHGYVAHRGDTSDARIDLDLTICGKPDRRLRGFEPDVAAYVAVPCRRCFPDAPPPGWRASDSSPAGVDGLRLAADPHLAWQVE